MPEEPDSNWGKILGLGLEIAVGVGLGFIAGTWLDQKFGWTPWGVLVGVMLGFAAGMYPLIREALKANK